MAKIRHGEAEAIVILGPKPPYLSRQSRKMHLDIPHFLLLMYFEDHSAFQVRFKTQQAFLSHWKEIAFQKKIRERKELFLSACKIFEHHQKSNRLFSRFLRHKI